MQTVIGTGIEEARMWLDAGNVVGIPTETVYGLAGNALNTDAVLKIFSVKNRPHFDPLIVHTFHRDELPKYVTHIPDAALKLMDAFMPGPLTLLLHRKSCIPDLVTSGLDTVAVRIPNHPLTLELLKSLDYPLAAPSANPFGYISPTSSYHVYDQLHGRIPYILDGGYTEIGVESTIVGFEDEMPVIYRLGGLSLEDLQHISGNIKLNVQSSTDPRAPGQLKSHYAPAKKLMLLDDPGDVPSDADSHRTGILGFDRFSEHITKENQLLLSPSGRINEAAKNLFAFMRLLDKKDIDIIYAIKVPDTGLGRAINDRLQRASA